MTTVSETLYKAADRVEEMGWGTGPSSMLGHGGLCLMGAIHVAHTGRFDIDYSLAASCPAGQAVYNYLHLDAGDVDAGWRWNDARDPLDIQRRAHTQAEVVEVLRAAAVIEAAKESAPQPEAAKVGASA